MGRRELNPWDILIQLESDLRTRTEGAMRAVLFYPCVDMYETDSGLVIKMELAGVPAENVNIVLSSDDRTITISGRRNERNDERNSRLRCYQLEIFYGEFSREIALPQDFAVDRDKIGAVFQDGFLVISLSKKGEGRNESRVIEVKQG